MLKEDVGGHTQFENGEVTFQQVEGVQHCRIPREVFVEITYLRLYDRKANGARKKLMDWDNRKDRGTKGYEGRDSQV